MPDALKSSFIVYPPFWKNISNYFLRIKLFKEYTFTPILNTVLPTQNTFKILHSCSISFYIQLLYDLWELKMRIT